MGHVKAVADADGDADGLLLLVLRHDKDIFIAEGAVEGGAARAPGERLQDGAHHLVVVEAVQDFPGSLI